MKFQPNPTNLFRQPGFERNANSILKVFTFTLVIQRQFSDRCVFMNKSCEQRSTDNPTKSWKLLFQAKKQNRQIVVKIEILLSVIYASFFQMFSTSTVLETALRDQGLTTFTIKLTLSIMLSSWGIGILE